MDELPRLQARHAAAMKFFQSVADTNDLDACVRVLEPEDVRSAFDLAFRRFSQSMDMLLPDPRALAHHADLRWLGKIRGAARARFRDDRLDLSGCGEKVRKLIADAVIADGIEILVKEVQLFSQEFDEKVEALGTDDAKASEMEHAIRHEISVRVEENPVFYQSLRERLEEIIEQRRQERLEAAEQLKLLNDLREDLKGEQSRSEELALDARGFAIYGLLEKQRPRKVKDRTATYDAANRDLASLIDEAVTPFTDLVDWQQKDDAQREMRREIKRRFAPVASRTMRSSLSPPTSWTSPRYVPTDDRRPGDLGDHLGRHAAGVRHPPQCASKEDGSGDGGPVRRRAARGPGAFLDQPAGCGRAPEGGLDRPAPPARPIARPAAVAAGVRQRRERPLSRAALPLEGASERGRRRETARRLAACTRAGGSTTEGARPGRPRVLVPRHAAERLPERVEAWRSRAGVEMPRVVIADQQKRWGRCDHGGTIRLNWRIIQAPMRLVDYVVAHELVHLRHRGHGRDYWQALGSVMPDYERRREDLRQRGGGLAW